MVALNTNNDSLWQLPHVHRKVLTMHFFTEGAPGIGLQKYKYWALLKRHRGSLDNGNKHFETILKGFNTLKSLKACWQDRFWNSLSTHVRTQMHAMTFSNSDVTGAQH